MKTITTTAIVALMVASIGLTAAAPAMAQQANQPRAQHHMHQQGDGPNRQFGHDGPRRPMQMQGGGLLGSLFDFGRTSEKLEIALVRLSHRLELTDAQKTLFEDYKTAALAAQAKYSSALDAARPARTDAASADTATKTRPAITERLDTRIALAQAHVDALTAVQPSFAAFFDSLTDAQKADLTPQRQARAGWQQDWHGQRGQQGKRGDFNRSAPGVTAPQATPAPTAAPIKS